MNPERIEQEGGKTGSWIGKKTKPSRLPAFLFKITLFLALTLFASSAHAQQQTPPSPATLASRQATYAWDKTLLRASFSYRDVGTDPAIQSLLGDGLKHVVAMRAYVFLNGATTPVALTVKTCNVVYDLWDEVYRLTVTEPGKNRTTAAVNLNGVLRECAEARELAVVDRSLLTSGSTYFLGVIADVDPISPQMLAQMQRWMSRPTGSTSLAPTDALFGSFANLFVRQVAKSAKTINFRTQGVVVP